MNIPNFREMNRLLRKELDENEDGSWRYPGYDKLHIDRVSRFLFHTNDVHVPKYGAACCVSFQSNRTLSKFRDLEPQHMPAGVPAGATICAPRPKVGD